MAVAVSTRRLLLAALCGCVLPSGAQLMRRETPKAEAPSTSATAAVAPVQVLPEQSLRLALKKVLGHVDAERLFMVEDGIRPKFEAFPKNAAGRVHQQALHEMAHSYFAREHGWLIKGFEPPISSAATEVQEAQILREKAPEIAEALLELRQSDRGLSLADAVSIVTAVEQLVLEDTIPLLEGAYALNNHSQSASVSTEELHRILQSYLILFRQGARHNFTDYKRHQVMRSYAEKDVDGWKNIVEFEEEAVAAYLSQSGVLGVPFSSFAFSDASSIVKYIVRGYGRWQNSECFEMKTALMDLEMKAGALASGRVSLEAFYAEPAHEHFKFAESADYLRQIGALDETVRGEEKVIVSNYLAAPSNCIASSDFFSVCCLDECESVTRQVESGLMASAVSPEALLELVAGIGSSSIEAPRKLPAALDQRAHAIAKTHIGQVPLHSGDFKQWLHQAFPNECPVPTSFTVDAEESESKAAELWIGAQQECTRIPKWETSAEEELVRV